MKRTLKYALLASTAAFVLGMAVPSQAQQQDNMRTARAMTQQRTYQPYEANRYSAMRDYDAATIGYDAYAYVPGDLGFGGGGCATQGGYGKGLDYSLCGGGGD